jgi:glycosyltransferase involved in cell wall biosynthesis
MYDEILPRMCDKYDSLYINLLTSGRCKKVLPRHPHINHHALFPIDNILRPTRFWGNTRLNIRAYLQYLACQDNKGKIWHSTYYTMPYNWKGPVVLTVYDMIFERFALDIFTSRIYNDYRIHKKHCVEGADLIICISEATKLDLEKFILIDPGKIKVIHLAASPVFRRMEYPGNIPEPIPPKPFLLYVGLRSIYKNFRNFLNAYSLWHKRNEVNLVVVGCAWTKQEREMIKVLKLSGQVFLLIDVDKEKLTLLYNLAIAFVFPSFYEGFGIPLLEAMACGCPIVASRIPSTIEVAGEVPVYFEPGEIDSIVSALGNVLNARRDSKRLELGLNRVNQFSWDITAHETLNIYRELLLTS